MSLSDNDKSVIFLADKLDAKVISSDKAVRNYAKSKAIDCHGMLWNFEYQRSCHFLINNLYSLPILSLFLLLLKNYRS